jgi:hypothetical protein
MANILVNSRSLSRADLNAIDIVLADPSRFGELSELQRNYMQNIARAVPAHAKLDGYSDAELLEGIARSDAFVPFDHPPMLPHPALVGPGVPANECGECGLVH